MTRWLTALLFASLFAPLARADEALPRDDNNVYGTFDDGMQYIIRHNANPPGRVSFYLHVRTGALNETDSQNGLAHFIEHMAFNGSKHFPPGKLLPLLGSLGMTFGADTNAHTNLWETVYKLNLPDTHPREIELAAKIFSDYASELLLSDEEINNERKVILEESRTRKSAGQRINKLEMKAEFPDTRLALHDVIGDEDQIRAFPPGTFRDYWNTWYRPENMTLIVVGDVKADDVLPFAKQWLGSLKPRTDARPAQKAGLHPLTAPRAFVFTDPEQVLGEVEVTNIAAGRPPITTYAQFRQKMLLDLSTGMVNRRLRNLIAAGHAPFRDAQTSAGTFLNEVTTAGGEADGEPKDWQPMLAGLITEMDRAVAHGFLPGELKLIESGLIAEAEQAVVAEATRDSTAVIDDISEAVGQATPLLSAKQELNLLKRVVAETNVDELQRAFTAAFATRNYDYVLHLPSGKADLTIPTSDQLMNAADAAWAVKTEPLQDDRVATSVLDAEPKAGTVVSVEKDADLKISTVVFADGVVLHHKFSDYKKDEVSVSMTLPGGQLEETDATRGVSALAGVLLEHPATGRFTSTQLNDLLTGKNVSVGGGVGRDGLNVKIVGTAKDLPVGFQLAYALLTDGALEQSAVDDWKKSKHQEIAESETQAQGQLQKLVARTLYGNDPRFRPLTDGDVDRLTRADAEAWFKRIAGSAAVEVAVVGDIQLKDTIELVARYAGSLPDRQKPFEALDALRKIDRPAGPIGGSVTFPSVTPQAIALAGFIAPEDTNPDRRPLNVAAEVLTNRMIERIRENEQLVYSIDTYSQPGHGLPGTGMFTAGSPTDPAHAQRLADEVVSMMQDFAKSGPTDAELATAKKQILTETTTAMREPDWWLTQIAELRYRHRPLADLKNLPGVYDTFTADQVRDVVAKYLKAETVIRLLVIPETARATPVPATKPAS